MRFRFSIRQRIALIFTLLVLLLLVTSAIALLFTQSAENTVNDIQNGSNDVNQADDLRVSWLSMASTIDRLLLTRQSSLIDTNLAANRTDFETRLENIQTETLGISSNTQQENTQLTKSIGELGAELLSYVDEVVGQARDGEWTRAQSIRHTNLASIERRFLTDVESLAINVSTDVSASINESTSTQNDFRTFVIAISVVGVIIALIISIITTLSVTRPLAYLIGTVREIQAGDFSKRAEVGGRDELSDLARSFNSMTEQLQKSIASLEERVQARTRELEAVFAVNTQVGTILEVDRLLQDVTDMIKERFDLYHAHIFLYDPKEEALILTAGAGHVGRQMVREGRIININNLRSIVARAARNRDGVVVNDVTEATDFLPHPLLPNTRSELAVPLIARGRLLGVLDVQSAEFDHFANETLSLMEILATQVAIALNNATLYEVAERTSRRERTIGNITQRIQNAVSIDEILQATIRELGKALRVPHTAIELRLPENISMTGDNADYAMAERETESA